MKAAQHVTVSLDGQEIEVPAHGSIAFALLAAGVTNFQTTAIRGTSRTLFCGMGSCYECLLTVDGERVRACLTPVTPNMQICRGGPRG